MNNPQRKFADIELGWLVGMIDGEGTIGISLGPKRVRGNARYRQMIPYINIAGTREEALKRVVALYQCLELPNRKTKGVPHHIMWFENRQKNYRKGWIIAIRGFKRVQPMLEFLAPHLVIKKKQAEVLLAFIRSRLARGERTTSYNDFELACYQQIRELNAKGNQQGPFRDYTRDVLSESAKG